jgi:hypothetical protein
LQTWLKNKNIFIFVRIVEIYIFSNQNQFFPDFDGRGETRGHSTRGGQEEDLLEGLQGPHRQEQVEIDLQPT